MRCAWISASVIFAFVASCGGDEFTSGDTTSTQQTTGAGAAGPSTGSGATSSSSTTSATSTGGGGSGPGGGGTGGGACGPGAICAAPAPSGWQGPAVIFVGDGAAPACGPQWMNQLDGGMGTVQGMFSCGDCHCDAPSGTCQGALEQTNSTCTGIDAVLPFDINSECTSFSAAHTALKVTPGKFIGACAPSGGAVTKEPVQWDKTVRVCTAPQAKGCTGGGTCVTTPASFQTKACIYADGAMACPAGPYATSISIFAGFTDTRMCSTCGCGGPTGVDCGGTVMTYGAIGCTGAASQSGSAGTCISDATGFKSYAFTPSNSGGQCQPVASAPSGSVVPAMPMTVCCTS